MGNSYKTECPSCGHHSFYITPHNGIGYCFRASCHYLERDNKTVERKKVRSEYVDEIRQYYTHMAKYYHSCLDSKARSYLIKRGFTDQTIQDLQIGYCPEGSHPFYKDPIANEAGLSGYNHTAFLGNRITFPYFKNAETVIDLRGRSLDPNEELRYKSPHKSAYYRGAIYPYNYHLAKDVKKLVITEGEIKADLSLQAGYITLGLPGISSWRGGFIPQDDQQLIFVFDNESNPDTQRDIIAALRKIARIVPHDIHVAVLPRMPHEKKAEIDTFILTHGVTLYQAIITNALTFNEWNALQAF